MRNAELIIALAASFCVSCALTPAARQLGRRLGVVDVPKERSSHDRPTPRTGGVAIVISWAGTFLLLNAGMDRLFAGLLAAVAVLALVGFADDWRSLSWWLRFTVQVAVALVVAIWGGVILEQIGVPFGRVSFAALALPLTVLWLVGYTNAFNFMDGINGMAAVHAIVAAAAFAVLALRYGESNAAGFSLACCGAALGFLPWNLPSGSVFMGDVGSTAVGFALAALAAHLSNVGVSFIAAALPLLPFLFDTSVTLVRRIWRQERLFTAHRSHLYQLLVQQGWSHSAVTMLWGGLSVLSAALSISYDFISSAAQTVAAVGMLAAHTIIAVLIVRGRLRVGTAA